MVVTVTCDTNVDIKRLRHLERRGLIHIHAIAIEGMEHNRKATHKHFPTAVIGSEFAQIDRALIARVDTPYHEIQKVIGKQNHGDAIHFEAHLRDQRDIFVTDDNDFLSCRSELEAKFRTVIKTTDELAAMFDATDPP